MILDLYYSCKLMHDKILTLIFEYFAISSKTMSFFVPERAHYLGYMRLGELFPCFSKSLIKMVNIPNFYLEYLEFDGQSSGSSSSTPAGMSSSKYRTWTRWITAYGHYLPTLYSRWKFMTLTILRSNLEKHGQSSPGLIYQIQCAPSGTECDIVFELMAKIEYQR